MARKTEDLEESRRRDLLRINLVRFRKELGLSQSQAAQRAGVEVDNVRRYEQGARGRVDALVLDSLAKALGHSVDHFFVEDPPPHDPALIPAFMLKTIPGVAVDDDLQTKVRQFLAGVNREHQERLRKKKGVKAK